MGNHGLVVEYLPANTMASSRRRIAQALRSDVGYPRIWNSWRRKSSTRSRFSHEQYAGGTWTNPLDVESRDSPFRSWRPHTTRTRECRTDGDASFRCKTDPGSIPGGCNKQRQTIWRRLFLPFFCTRTRRRYIHVTLHTETTTCTTFREVCDRIRARLALT